MTRASAAEYRLDFVGWLSVAQLVTWGSTFYTFALLLTPVEAELGLARDTSSLGFSLALLTEGLCAYQVGRWIDRGHERAVMTGGSVLLGLALLVHSQVNSLMGFYAAWVLMGAGMAGTLYSPIFAVLTRRFPNSFRRAIITTTFLGGLASTVFIPLGAWLIAELGWRHALWVLAALQFGLCVPIHAWFLRDAPGPLRPAAPAGEPPAVISLRAFWRQGAFRRVAVFSVTMMAVTAALPPHLINILRETQMPEAWVIAIAASIGVIQVLGRVLMYFFEHRYDVHLANRLIPCLVPLGLGALIVGLGSPIGGLIFVLLFGLGNGMITIVKGTAIAQYVSRDHVAALNGALGLPSAIARALAPWALGLLWSPGMGYQLGLWLLLALAVMATAAMWQAQRLAHRS